MELTCLGNARSIIFLFSNCQKKVETERKKPNKYYFFSPFLSSRARTEHILSWIQLMTSFLRKCVLGRKNCFISTNPSGLPGRPPTLSTSITFICWPTEDHQNEAFAFLPISKWTGKIAGKRTSMKEMANKHYRWSCVTFRNYCRLPVLKTVSLSHNVIDLDILRTNWSLWLLPHAVGPANPPVGLEWRGQEKELLIREYVSCMFYRALPSMLFPLWLVLKWLI